MSFGSTPKAIPAPPPPAPTAATVIETGNEESITTTKKKKKVADIKELTTPLTTNKLSGLTIPVVPKG